jgi:hypothetical protein
MREDDVISPAVSVAAAELPRVLARAPTINLGTLTRKLQASNQNPGLNPGADSQSKLLVDTTNATASAFNIPTMYNEGDDDSEDDWEPEKKGPSNDTPEQQDISQIFRGRYDYSFLNLKDDHGSRPLWLSLEKETVREKWNQKELLWINVISEAFSPIAQQAQDFLVAIGEPMSR